MRANALSQADCLSSATISRASTGFEAPTSARSQRSVVVYRERRYPAQAESQLRSDQAVLDMVATGFHEAFGEAATMIPRDHAGPGDVQVFGWTKPKGMKPSPSVSSRARSLLIKAV